MEKPAFEVGQVWLTENNSRVRILATDMKDPYYPIVGAMESGDEESLECFTEVGWYDRRDRNHEYNLVKLAPKRIVVEEWFNIIHVNNALFHKITTDKFDSKESALNHIYTKEVTVHERAIPFKWVGEEKEAKEVE